MAKKTELMITKSDFLLYLDAPRHLWAQKHGRIEQPPSEFLKHIFKQGYEVETLAMKFLESVVASGNGLERILRQQTYVDGPFLARVDALVYKPESNNYDLYEVKSGVGVSKANQYDIAFQKLILDRNLALDRCYLLHPNKEYIFNGELDLSQLFTADDITSEVVALLPEVEAGRQAAHQVALVEEPYGLEPCYKPDACPCPNTCHPDLPDFSIFDIPRLTHAQKRELLNLGILSAAEVPDSFNLNDKQRLIVGRARTNEPYIDRAALAVEMEKITFPVYFLDYETCIAAVPLYPGYHPQQQVVFQYSLHRLDDLSSEPVHYEHLSTDPGDPALPLLEQLRRDLGDSGSVVAWYKPFEMTRNREMAILHPQYADFLDQVNQRIYDLSDPVNYGYLLHPGFKGSYSIKDVLPVLKPELAYDDLDLNAGEQASLAWWNVMFGDLGEAEKTSLCSALLRYCERDTLAMVQLFKEYRSLIS